LEINVTREKIRIKNNSKNKIQIVLYGEEHLIGSGKELSAKTIENPNACFRN
jgi:hypothetical protein